jgi:hypothetical protein
MSKKVPNRMVIPDHLVYPPEALAEAFKDAVRAGEDRLRESSVAFVGLARNCATHLHGNLLRLVELSRHCRDWRLHIETNDNNDETTQVLADFCNAHRRATFADQRLGREQFTAEFAGRRTIALAEYRTACQRWVQDAASDADYVVAIDWDAWGGWSHIGFMHGIGSLARTADAYGMASVSMIQHPTIAMGEDQKPHLTNAWVHYDAWSYRLNDYWDDYTAGLGGWKHQHLPAVGSRPFPVCSAFGGLAIYETAAYLGGTYDGATDCEHVAFHRSIAEIAGQRLYMNPSMRTVMHWMEQDDGGQHGHH